MESLDVKELVIYEVRAPDLTFLVVRVGTLNDGRCVKVKLLRIGSLA